MNRRGHGASALVGVVLALGPAGAARAQDAWSVSTSVGTDYRSKGVSKTGGRPGAALEAERALAGDAYLGLSANSVRNTAGSDAQVNLELDWRPRAFGSDWRFSSTREIYPGSRTVGNDVVWQLSASAARDLGALAAEAGVQHQPDGFGETGANTYVSLEAAWPLSPGLKAVGGVGRRQQENSVDYTAWNAGVVLRLPARAGLDLRWFATDQAAQGPNYRDRLVAALKLDF